MHFDFFARGGHQKFFISMRKMIEWYKSQSDTAKAFIWIGLVCIVGIALRWNHIIEMATKGFQYYSGN